MGERVGSQGSGLPAFCREAARIGRRIQGQGHSCAGGAVQRSWNMIAAMLASASSDEQNQVILTVDDDPNNLAVIRDCLAAYNYTILVAEDGESAIQRADYVQPDL